MASSLIATEEIEEHVQSGLALNTLERVVESCDADIIRYAGPHDGEQTVVIQTDPYMNRVTLPRPAESIGAVKEWGIWESEPVDSDEDDDVDDSLVPELNYVLENGGRTLLRIGGVLIRTSNPVDTRGVYWRRNVKVTFTPFPENDRRRMVLINLVKHELMYSGASRERVGSYETYPLKESDRMAILSRLRQSYGGGGLFA